MFVDVLHSKFMRVPETIAFVLIGSGGEDRRLSYKEVWQAGLNAAADLQKAKVLEGDRVLLSLSDIQQVLAYLLGTWILGGIPSVVSAELSDPKRPAMVAQLTVMAAQVQAKAVITSQKPQPGPGTLSLEPPIELITADNCFDHSRQEPLQRGNSSNQETAYLQFTSGTTGKKKAAIISNSAINACMEGFKNRFEIVDTDVFANWLPLHHDLGFFGGLLLPAVMGLKVVLISPLQCLRSPSSYFQALDTHKCTVSWITNSAFHYFADRVDQTKMRNVNLSKLRIVCAGGERVQLDSRNRFVKKFSLYGLSSDAIITGYGMAETTMGITACAPGEQIVDWVDPAAMQNDKKAKIVQQDFANAQSVLSCGTAIDDASIRIVDDDLQAVPDRIAGRILLRGKSLFDGYYDSQASSDLTTDDGWFISGDRGYLAEGHLFVLGRNDDLIISAAQKIQPEEIESLIEKHSAIAKGRSVAIGVYDDSIGTEKIILICALKRDLTRTETFELEAQLRASIKSALNIVPQQIVFARKIRLAVTANGKLPRMRNKQRFLAGEFQT